MTVETYGGARLLKIFLWPNPQTIGQLVLLYCIPVDDYISNLVFEKTLWKWPTQNLIETLFMLFLVMGFVHLFTVQC
jgi:hypothetical protein